ncbi:MAG: hypothetical protein HAW67_06175 [Endozoicomonadaceae bacterium]|nr:hypothetical protein [Endozoicomonadaceae bacterium]
MKINENITWNKLLITLYEICFVASGISFLATLATMIYYISRFLHMIVPDPYLTSYGLGLTVALWALSQLFLITSKRFKTSIRYCLLSQDKGVATPTSIDHPIELNVSGSHDFTSTLPHEWDQAIEMSKSSTHITQLLELIHYEKRNMMKIEYRLARRILSYEAESCNIF